MSALRPAFFILYLESFISRLNVILCHDLTLSVNEPDNAAAKQGEELRSEQTAINIHEQRKSLLVFASQQFGNNYPETILSAAVEGKNRPVATNFQFLKISCPSGTSLLQCVCISEVILLGRACPKPCSSFVPYGTNGTACRAYRGVIEQTGGTMTKTNVQPIPSNSQHHDTPNNKTHVIKFRVTAEEKTSLELTCKLLNLSLSTFIRRAIHNVKIEKTIIVAGGGEETLTAVSTLLAQCSKVGTNLNQLARHFNSGGADTEQIRAKLLDELADLTAFRLHAEKVLGELYGNAQAYRL